MYLYIYIFFFVSGINSPKITYHVFICDSKKYMEKLFGNYFLENLISVAENNVFGIDFATISGWSVVAATRLCSSRHVMVAGSQLL